MSKKFERSMTVHDKDSSGPIQFGDRAVLWSGSLISFHCENSSSAGAPRQSRIVYSIAFSLGHDHHHVDSFCALEWFLLRCVCVQCVISRQGELYGPCREGETWFGRVVRVHADDLYAYF